MTELAVKPPTIPIPFHKLLKVVAIVDPDDAQIRQLLDHIAAAHFEVEVATDFDRDVSEDAAVGAYHGGAGGYQGGGHYAGGGGGYRGGYYGGGYARGGYYGHGSRG